MAEDYKALILGIEHNDCLYSLFLYRQIEEIKTIAYILLLPFLLLHSRKSSVTVLCIPWQSTECNPLRGDLDAHAKLHGFVGASCSLLSEELCDFNQSHGQL